MNGILLVNKPFNYTSRDVVNKLNKYFQTKRVGHTGTLDPLATGLLIICIGKYTKLVDLITSETKEYIAKIKLGISTDTYDITGNILSTSNNIPSKDEVISVLNNFQNLTYQQEVPKYSAVKIKGKKLYEYARSNETVELPKREVTIYDIKLINYDNEYIEFKTTVSKGTYIRSLIVDICHQLNVCGTMSSLIRTKQGNLSIANSYTLEDILNDNYKLTSLTEIFPDYAVVNLNEEEYQKVKNGSSIACNFSSSRAIYQYNNEIIAIYQKDNNKAKPYKMLTIDSKY